MSKSVVGRVHSIQSMGTLDGPGVRFVAFLQGCPLRCGCCHNPDTWDFDGGNPLSADALVEKAMRYRTYFGERGGITLSGGEPLCQAVFCEQVFSLCHQNGIHTCLDTSGCVLNDTVKAALSHCDRVLLDIKYTEKALYTRHVGCELNTVMAFLAYLNAQNIPTTLRQVIIPTLNDTKQNVERLVEIAKAHPNVDKIELLPFKKICQVKYTQMDIPFPFADKPTPTADDMRALSQLLGKYA